MKKTLMLATILMSVLMLSACEHYFPYYGGDGYYSGGHGDGDSGGGEHDGEHGGGEND